MAGITYSYFLWDRADTTALPLPLQLTDRIAVARGPSGSAVTYYAALATLLVSTPVYQHNAPATGATLVAGAGLGAFVLEPAAPLATLAVVLPPTPVDGQVFDVSTTQTITALTVSAPGGATVSGGTVGVLAANGGASWRYRSTNTTWYRRS